VVVRATNTKVNVELISETFVSIVFAVGLIPKPVTSSKSTGIKKIYFKFSLIYLSMVYVLHTIAKTSVQLLVIKSRGDILLSL